MTVNSGVFTSAQTMSSNRSRNSAVSRAVGGSPHSHLPLLVHSDTAALRIEVIPPGDPLIGLLVRASATIVTAGRYDPLGEVRAEVVCHCLPFRRRRPPSQRAEEGFVHHALERTVLKREPGEVTVVGHSGDPDASGAIRQGQGLHWRRGVVPARCGALARLPPSMGRQHVNDGLGTRKSEARTITLVGQGGHLPSPPRRSHVEELPQRPVSERVEVELFRIKPLPRHSMQRVHELLR